jgi:hypothetical protein
VNQQHMNQTRNALTFIGFFALACLGTPWAFSQQNSSEVEVGDPVYPRIINIDLRDLPRAPGWRPGDPVREVPRLRTSTELEVPVPEPKRDPLLDRQAAVDGANTARAFGDLVLNFSGQGYTGVNPPDTVGAVGKDYYIQSVNGSGTPIIIYNKSDGSVAAGPIQLGSFSSCSGSGDPIILYDALEERWFLSEFGSGNSFCVLISQTDDPIAGGWFEYNFTTPSFPDYPKYGVWGDAYYVTANENSPSVYALEKPAMLVGAAARSVRFTASSLAGFSFQALTPAHLEGLNAPPGGSPNFVMRHRDDESHNAGSNNPSEDYLEIYSFHVDWSNTANSSFTGPQTIAITEIDSNLNGLTAFSCFSQPGSSTKLDPLREVIMFPLIYHNYGSHESLFGTLVTDVDGTDHGGVRWFELRRSGGAWALYQEGTYAPDQHSRWMSSGTMDQKGNIAIGYNISSTTQYPSLRYAGRLATDPLGTLPQGEHVIVEGSAANSSNRYGDYSSMSLDPVDLCTMWFTGMYNTSSSWSTYVAAMNFESCLCTPLAAPASVTADVSGNNEVTVSWSSVSGAESYSVYRTTGTCPGDSWVLLADQIVGTTYVDTTVSGGSTYSYTVTSYDLQEDCESTKDVCDAVQATGDCLLSPSFAGVAEVYDSQLAACQLVISWDPATSSCGGNVVYAVYRGLTSDFTPSAGNRIANCLTDTNYIDHDVTSYTMYYYIVQAEDTTSSGSGPCNGGNVELNTVVLGGSASGPDTVFFEDDLESGSAQWTVSTVSGSVSDAWALEDDPANASSPSHVYFVPDIASTQDHRLATVAPLQIPGGAPAQLTFMAKWNSENRYDGVALEYSTNGTDWFDILASDEGSVPADPDRILSNGYTGNFSGGPLSGRPGWYGSQTSYVMISVDLGDMTGLDLHLRWRMSCDGSVATTNGGFWLDDVRVFYGTACQSGGCGSFDVTASSGDPVCQGDAVQLSVQLTNETGPTTFSWSPSTYLSDPQVMEPLCTPTETTTYTLTATDNGVCVKSTEVTVWVLPTNRGHYYQQWRTEPDAFDFDDNGLMEILDYVHMVSLCPQGVGR